MKYLKLFKLFLLEKRSLEEVENVSVSHKVVNFLNKHNHKDEESYRDSDIFVSLKTGDFQSIIPIRSLGGTQYTSPQGFYCFDMNIFKERLFGDDKISIDNFSVENLKKSSNIIKDLGLGYANNGNKVSKENLWYDYIPRYLYFVKVKDGSLILSKNSNTLKFYDPLKKLLKSYSHYFLKDEDMDRFDPKDKLGDDLKYKSFIELKKYFTDNKDKYKEDFIDGLSYLMKSMDKDKKSLHALFYNFLLDCCRSIHGGNEYIRFTLLCATIGVDGFTQRESDGSFIHPSPKSQTLILTSSCVEELMKIDLRTELKKDAYVDKSKAEKNWDEFYKSLNPGDILYHKKFNSFVRFSPNTVLKKENPDNFTKVDLSNNKIWNFIKTLKSGDWIKITGDIPDSSKIMSRCRIIQLNKEDFENELGPFTEIKAISDIRFIETTGYNEHVIFTINGEIKNPKFPYDISTKDSETPLLDPSRVNDPKYKYWIDNKSELEKQGCNFDNFFDEYEKKDIFNNLDEILVSIARNYDDLKPVSKHFQIQLARPIARDLDLLRVLTNFSKEYSHRVFFSENDLIKEKMTLYVYRGNLDRPIKVIYSNNPQF